MATGDLTTLANALQWLGQTGLQIVAITEANPAVVTLATRPSFPLLSGYTYAIAGATGMALPNAEYVVTVIDPLSFSIPFDSTSAGAYTGGAYVSITAPLVQRLISSVSAYAQNYMGRVIANTRYTLTFNGQDMPTMMLPQWPVTAINALQINGSVIDARPALAFPSTTSNGYGYTYQAESAQLALTGYLFTRGYNNVAVDFDAGFMIADEAQTIPASAPYTLTTIARWSAGDKGVTFDDGTALVKVTSAPAQGQYSVDGSVYTFAAADAGLGVLISYAMVPFDIEQAVLDTVGDWFMYQSRIGVTSKSIEGQSISYTNYTNTAFPVRARGVLDQYKKAFPG